MLNNAFLLIMVKSVTEEESVVKLYMITARDGKNNNT